MCPYDTVLFVILRTCLRFVDEIKLIRSSRDYHGEGNGTPPPYSCLENPMDGGAWWAAVHGVAKSRT